MPVASSLDPNPFSWVFIWGGILVVVLMVAFAGYSWFKRWMNQSQETGPIGFTLSDLRELHRQGKMSDEEFEQTKAKMIGSAKKMADQMPQVLPRRVAKSPRDGGQSGPPVT